MSDSTVAPGSKVLVTGGSGFIGIWVVKAYLDAGFKVVTTVRSTAKGEYLAKQFAGQPFEYAIVEDIGAPGAFDAVVAGVDAVAHTASPFHFNVEDPEELIRPAVDGTLEILKAVTAHGKDVKRVVITSSVAAIQEPREPPSAFTEADWNRFSVAEVAQKGKDASPVHAYLASKALAERAAWDYVEEHPIPLVTINPPLVFGPILHEVSTPDQLNTSVAIFYDIVQGKKTVADLPGGGGGNCIDVRTLADAHVRALTVPAAAGNRYIVSQAPFCTQQLCDVVLSLAPESITKNVPVGEQGAVEKANDPRFIVVSDGSKAVRELGIEYKTVEETATDMYYSLAAKGW